MHIDRSREGEEVYCALVWSGLERIEGRAGDKDQQPRGSHRRQGKGLLQFALRKHGLGTSLNIFY